MNCRKPEMKRRKPEMKCRKPEMKCRKPEMKCRKPEMKCRKPEMKCRKPEMNCGKSEMKCRRPETNCGKTEMVCYRAPSKTAISSIKMALLQAFRPGGPLPSLRPLGGEAPLLVEESGVHDFAGEFVIGRHGRVHDGPVGQLRRL